MSLPALPTAYTTKDRGHPDRIERNGKKKKKTRSFYTRFDASVLQHLVGLCVSCRPHRIHRRLRFILFPLSQASSSTWRWPQLCRELHDEALALLRWVLWRLIALPSRSILRPSAVDNGSIGSSWSRSSLVAPVEVEPPK